MHGLKLRVGRASLDRALDLADSLLKASEAKGHVAAVGEQPLAGAHIVINGERVDVAIKEGVDRVPHEPTKKELDEKKRWSWTKIPEFDTRPSGILTFVIGTARGAKSNWSEGKRWRLEERIDAVLGGMTKAAAALREERLEREQWQREWEERRHREAAEAQRRLEEHQRVERLQKQLDAWRKSKGIREFMAEVRQAAADGGREIDSESELGRWLSWVEAYGEQIDPLRELRRRPSAGAVSADS